MYEKEIESSEYQKLPDRGNALIVEWYQEDSPFGLYWRGLF